MRHSGLIVEVPEAEPAVGAWRSVLDPLAARGVPAHVTVLFPFVPVPDIDAATAVRLRGLFSTVDSFSFQLVDVGWFGETVLWLAPDADERFRRLTRLVEQAWPAFPPYGGQFDDAVPHLTVGDRGPAEQMRVAAHELRAALPIRASAHTVTLMTELPEGRWERATAFPLAGPGRASLDAPAPRAGAATRLELFGGVEQRAITIVDYDPAWPAAFTHHRDRIIEALGPRALAVDHIGSTAVPGLAAKPIIDIDLSVADVDDEPDYLPPLLAAGYQLRVREPDHRMLRTPPQSCSARRRFSAA